MPLTDEQREDLGSQITEKLREDTRLFGLEINLSHHDGAQKDDKGRKIDYELHYAAGTDKNIGLKMQAALRKYGLETELQETQTAHPENAIRARFGLKPESEAREYASHTGLTSAELGQLAKNMGINPARHFAKRSGALIITANRPKCISEAGEKSFRKNKGTI